jgi:transcriptional regulator with XRE-family HTH domain
MTPDEVPEEVGRVVGFHRKQAGLTQKGLGDLAGIGKTAVFDIEHGKATVRMDTLMKVLAVLNIRVVFQSPLMSAFEAVAKRREHDDAQR